MPQLIAFLAAVVVTAAYCWPALQWRVRPIERRFAESLRRPLVGWLLAGMLSLLANWQLAAHRGIPQPWVQDEFSYLLAADTFAHGRLTNPSHPLWRFFETFHELQRPTYMSKYPPGHGLMLAAGQVLTGEPVLGAWLESALLSVCAGWMLFGFVSAAESVLGAFVVAFAPVVVQWSQTYWGGSLAAVGGCLVLGAWARLFRKRRWRPGVALGLGLTILAVTRPYEGLLFSLPFVAWALSRPRAGVAAASLVLVCAGTWLMYDNLKVTGHALRLPYTAYERQYARAPAFLWQHVRPDHPYDRREMREMAEQVELPRFQSQRTFNGFLHVAWEKLLYLAQSLGTPWLLAAFGLWIPAAILADRRLRWAMGSGILVLAGTLASNWTRTQYVAPALPALLLLGIAAHTQCAMRHPALARGIAVGSVAGMVGLFVLAWGNPVPISDRNQFEQELLKLGGRHLVIVEYLPNHLLDDEWIYNAADIDASPVVWACDRGKTEDQQLIRYFAGRTLWRCTVDATAARYNQVWPTSEAAGAR